MDAVAIRTCNRIVVRYHQSGLIQIFRYMEQIYIPKQDYKVLVRCFTYNQSKYIEEALNGFAMQITDFPFVCHIQDDASTDGEHEVITSWMERECDMQNAEIIDNKLSQIILVPHKSNMNCTFAFYFLKRNLYREWDKKIELVEPWRSHCQYEALCEGDDYWIDPHKLEKQVSILDNNESIFLCGSNGVVHYDGLYHEPQYFNHINESKILSPEEIIPKWLFPTASMICRTDLLRSYPEWTKKIYSGDKTLVLLALNKGGVYSLSDITCVYRRTRSELSASNEARARSRNFVTDQHILLFEEYDKYTNGRYHSVIAKHLKHLKKRSKVYKMMNRSVFIAFFVDPITFWNIVKKRLPWNSLFS